MTFVDLNVDLEFLRVGVLINFSITAVNYTGNPPPPPNLVTRDGALHSI